MAGMASASSGYCVYQFSKTLETCVLPTSWVIDGQVKYDSRKASDYAKKGKMPYKKWRTYEVQPICGKIFDSYEAAYRAESILLEKSDLESTDIEAINNPTKILNRKRQRNKTFFPSDTFTDGDESNLSSSEDEVMEAKLPPVPPLERAIAIEQIVLNDTINDNKAELEGDQIIETPLSLATENHINELKELITLQNTKIDNLTVVVTNMSKQLRKIKHEPEDNNVTVVTRWAFPLQTIDGIKELDESLKNGEDGSAKEFKSYLLQLGGTTLKTTIKCIIKEIYSLELQQQLNYSGRENKFPTKDLYQTKLILEVMQLNTSKTRVEAVNEYMYHMQHVTDRIRAMMKKTK